MKIASKVENFTNKTNCQTIADGTMEARFKYEGHPGITDIPFGLLDTGRNKKFCFWKREAEDWNGPKGKSRSAVSKHEGERGSGLSYGRKQAFAALLFFNQWLRHHVKQQSAKKRFRIGSYQYQISFIELPKIEDWMSLSSGKSDFTLKRKLNGDGIWRSVILMWFWFTAISDLSLRVVFPINEQRLTIFFSGLTWFHPYLPFTFICEKTHRV